MCSMKFYLSIKLIAIRPGQVAISANPNAYSILSHVVPVRITVNCAFFSLF